MEPIDYLRAPIRRWPVLIPFAIVGAIVAVLIPVHTGATYPANMWKSNSTVGLAPSYPANELGAKVGIKQLQFYAHSPVVLDSAAKADGVTVSKQLKNDVVVGKASADGGGKRSGLLQLAVVQPTKAQAVSLTNAFVTALGAYVQVQLGVVYQHTVTKLQAQIVNLQNAINSLPKRPVTVVPTTVPARLKIIKIVPASTAPADPTTTAVSPTTTTPTTTPAQIRGTGTTTSSTSPASNQTASHQALSNQATSRESLRQGTAAPLTLRLVDTVTSTTVLGSTTSLPGVTTTHPGTVTTLPTQPSLPGRAVAQERSVLASELGQALASEQYLLAQGIPASGYTVLALAHQGTATLVPGGAPLVAHRSIRGLIGLVLGALLGVVAAWLLDGLDKRLRTAARAEEAFGLPVIAEIPDETHSGTRSKSVLPVVDVVVDPYSPTSEAYRKLHVAIRSAPLVTWVKRVGPASDGVAEPALRVPAPALEPARASAGAPGSDPVTTVVPVVPAGEGRLWSDDPVPEGTAPVAVTGSRNGSSPRRFAILVTSPGDEATRSLVVVNLAAVFAEAGERVLVATTGGMRTGIEGAKGPLLSEESLGDDPSAAALVANARPSQLRGVSSLALGQIFSSPSKLALKAGELVQAAHEVVDVLLLEAPLLTTQDAAALLPAIDVVVVVAESWHTTVAQARLSHRLVAQRRPPVLGVVLTNVLPANAPLFVRR